jgi:hypothetical protein
MNNKKSLLPKSTKNEVQTKLKQAKRKSSFQAEKRTEYINKAVLKFSPTAWAKLLYLRDKSDNEVGGFGITESADLLYVSDFMTVKQKVSAISVSFDDEAVSNFFDDQVDLGRKPEQFARIWIHCHPGDSPEPSILDEETFERVFGGCQWAILFVVGRRNHTYARLSFNVGPGGQILIPVGVDYSRDFGPSDHGQWNAEYSTNVVVENSYSPLRKSSDEKTESGLRDYALPYDFVEELENMDPTERQFILDEMGARPDPWDEESEVSF